MLKDVSKRKIELMKEKRTNNSVEVLNRLNIVTMLDAKYKSNIKEGISEDDALTEAVTKVSKDLTKELDYAKKSGNIEYIDKINTQVDELNKFKPSMMNESEISSYIKILLESQEEKHFGKLMGILTKDLKGKADMSLVSKSLKSLIK